MRIVAAESDAGSDAATVTGHGSAVVHGHRVSYRTAGTCDGRPVLVLVHGIAGDAQTWAALLPRLGEWAYVVAPDLPGHGGSEPGGGDTSIASYAAWVRDLIQILELPGVTVVGHSLGGGVAMQLAYMFPDLVERLVLVSAGGLGREVSPFLRLATLPGAELVIPLIASAPVLSLGRRLGSLAARIGLPARPGVVELSRGFASLASPVARHAFLRTVRASLSLGGQAVHARDRLYLTQVMPCLILWGARDSILPIAHGYAAREIAVGCQFEALEGAGHFPHCDEPARVDALVRRFVESTKPAAMGPAELRRLLTGG